jgi:hypothetical protein
MRYKRVRLHGRGEIHGTLSEMKSINNQYKEWSAPLPMLPNQQLVGKIKNIWDSGVMPEPIDPTRCQWRIEDALRKTASRSDLILVAELLGIKEKE